MPHPHDPRRGHVDLITESARDALHVRRAFGDPVTHGDVTIIPVARVRGGNGIGFGSGSIDAGSVPAPTSDESDEPGTGVDRAGQGDGGGGGFGVSVRPVGVYVVSGGDARWRPTVDVNRVVLGGQVVGAVAILAVTHLLRHRATLNARVAAAAAAPTFALPRPHLLAPGHLLRRLPRPHLVRRATLGTIGLVAAAARRARA